MTDAPIIEARFVWSRVIIYGLTVCIAVVALGYLVFLISPEILPTPHLMFTGALMATAVAVLFNGYRAARHVSLTRDSLTVTARGGIQTIYDRAQITDAQRSLTGLEFKHGTKPVRLDFLDNRDALLDALQQGAAE
ncbi:MAG: hypothetical protein N4A70_02675 [Pelagimonas sp.]|jgi:hypothetical protein|nr:hypothetical protein [Pelagimonas sp.]